MEAEATVMERPIPKPRRTLLETNKKYENVAIDPKSKEICIENENDNNNLNISNNLSLTESSDEIDFQKVNSDEKNIKLNNFDNDNNSKSSSESTTPIPAPRVPRKNIKRNNNDPTVYENVINANLVGSPSCENNIDNKSISYKSLNIPQLNIKNDNEKDKISRSKSPTYQISLSSSPENIRNYDLNKSESNSTINSSISSVSSNTPDNQKYKNPPPSQILKNLGTTSKLLTDAITERVTVKAQKAKHKLNENIKISQDFLHSLGPDTVYRSIKKTVRKKLNSTSSTKCEDFQFPKYESNSKEYHHQLVPGSSKNERSDILNNQVFQSISFHSPLDKKNLNRFSYPETYETPKNSIKKVNNDPNDDDCPTFEEAMKNRSYSLKNLEISSDNKNEPISRYKLKKDYENNIEEDDYRKSLCLPMPNYPAPVLELPIENSEDPVYGELRQIQPPIRLKRKSRVSSTREISVTSSGASNRATVDSLEFSSMSLKENIKEVVNVEEKVKKANKTDSPTSKSESWAYYDRVDDEEDDGNSSPEPIYANQEATYDRLCEMETNDSDIILSPKMDNISLSKHQKSPMRISEKDILYEFDPLRKKDVNDYRVNKSNQLLLLEHLLVDETYGVIENDAIILEEGQSLASSEEDNGNATGGDDDSASAMLPPTPTRIDSLPEAAISVETETLEPIIQSYLAKTDDTNPLDAMSQSQTNWFVDCNSIEKPQNYNPFNKNNQEIPKKVSKMISLPKLKRDEHESPPSYAEAIASDNGIKDANSKQEQQINLEQTSSSTSISSPSTKSKAKSVFSNVINKMDVLKRKTSFRTNRSKDVKIVLEMVPKPIITQNLVRYEGPLIRFPSDVVGDLLKEMQNRKAILRDKKFQTYQDHSMKNLKESFQLENITTIQCVSNNKITDSFTPLYCFEITIAIPKNYSLSSSSSQLQMLSNPNVILTNKDSGNCKLQRICHFYGVGKESERDIWMQKLIESLTTVFPSNYTCQYYRAGWCYLKRSTTSPWSGTWILLKKRNRKFLFYSEHEMNLEKVDLRKARCIVLKENDSTTKNLHVESGGPILMIDCPPYTLYMTMNFSRETKIWKHIIREVAHNNGPSLSEQQITKYNVPVIVDKCINFIYIYGSMSEGIYRKSGSENSIQKLISLFRVNAFSVEITRPEYSEHDVANVLKRFMRDLPQKLLSRYSESFSSIIQINDKTEKVNSLKELLNRLTVIEYQTLKKLIGHLSFISSLSSKNKMSVDNLAMIWGPTILQNKDDQASYSQKEADVISELILLYKDLFLLSSDEMKKEQDMLMCLQKYYSSGETLSHSMKKSGDLKVWITYNKDEKTQINITLTPTKTAYEVCKELSKKVKIPAHHLTLYEIVLNDNLERPLHHDVKVFDIVLCWSYWSELDRKNNYLVVRKNDIIKEIERALRNLPTVTPAKELKFADNKTKSLKLYNVELRDNLILIQKKDKNTVNVIKEISLDNTIAYLGCEKKREMPQSGWAITFIQQTTDNVVVTRSKESPYIGHVIAGTEWKDRIIWFSSIWHRLYGENNILPSAELVI